MRPPRGVWRDAFATRFCSTCSSRLASPSTSCASGAMSRASSTPRSRNAASWRSATRSNSHATGTVSRWSAMPPPSSRARSSRSPTIRLQPFRLAADDLHVAIPCRGVGHGIRNRQRLQVSADRGQRRHQLVRHVGEELPPETVGLFEIADPRVQVGRHAVERVGERRHFVAARLGRRWRRRARSERLRGQLQRAQASPRRAEDEQRHPEGAGHEQPEPRGERAAGRTRGRSGRAGLRPAPGHDGDDVAVDRTRAMRERRRSNGRPPGGVSSLSALRAF